MSNGFYVVFTIASLAKSDYFNSLKEMPKWMAKSRNVNNVEVIGKT